MRGYKEEEMGRRYGRELAGTRQHHIHSSKCNLHLLNIQYNALREAPFEYADYLNMSPANNHAAASSVEQTATTFHHSEIDTRASMINIIKDGLDSLPLATLMQNTSMVVPKPEERPPFVQQASPVVAMDPNDMHIGSDYEEAACDQLLALSVTPVRHMTAAAIRPAFYNTASSVGQCPPSSGEFSAMTEVSDTI